MSDDFLRDFLQVGGSTASLMDLVVGAGDAVIDDCAETQREQSVGPVMVRHTSLLVGG